MYLYGLDYVLSKGGMTLALQGQGHTIRITEIVKTDVFRWNHWTPFSVNSALFRRAESSKHFSKAYIQYFIESYGGLVKSVA